MRISLAKFRSKIYNNYVYEINCMIKEVFAMFNGEILKKAIISGANNISSQKNQINDLNIFPVPDGDTGTNMSMTIMAAA